MGAKYYTSHGSDRKEMGNPGHEHVKKFTLKQGYLAQRRRGAESTKIIKQLFNSNLCASASLREIVHFFTRSRYDISYFLGPSFRILGLTRGRPLLPVRTPKAGKAESQGVGR